MSVILRSAWGARPARDITKVEIGRRTATCTHHDGAHPIKVTTMEEACALMRKDQNQHMNDNGWSDIGYNFLVISAPGYAIDGQIFEGRGRDVVGAHCLNWNTPWIGIQVAVGGAQRPSDKALLSVKVLHQACEKGAGHKLAMKGHKDGFATACPGTFLTAWLKAGMPVGTKVAAQVAVKMLVKAVTQAPAKALARATNTLLIDGNFGAATVRRLQFWLGIAADGVAGPKTWSAFQARLKVTADGTPGPITWRAVQRMVGAPVDGVPGPATIKALQRYLNNK